MLKENQLLSMYGKCEFLLKSMAFVGHIISSDGVEVDPMKMQMVKNLPRPLTPINIRGFLGLSGYYRRFVNGFETTVSLLTSFTQMIMKFE